MEIQLKPTDIDVVAINAIILNDMKKNGWYDIYVSNIFPEFRIGVLPRPHDINNGNCEDWAIKAQELYGGEIIWLDTFKTLSDWQHCVLKLNGRYYDAIHPDGTRTLKNFCKQAREYFVCWEKENGNIDKTNRSKR